MNRNDVLEGRAWHRCHKPGRVVFCSGAWGLAHYECSGCDRIWNFRAMGRFTQQDLDDRFYLPVQPDPENKILVWKTEGKQCFVAAVPLKDAEGLERIDL